MTRPPLIRPRSSRQLCARPRYRLFKDVTIYLGEFFASLSDFHCKTFLFSKGFITIYAGYEWDGCSGGMWILEIWDGYQEENGLPQMYYPSLVHDNLYDGMDEMAEFWGVGVDKIRRWADNVFMVLAQDHKFEKAELYYWTVRKLGGIYHWFNKGKTMNKAIVGAVIVAVSSALVGCTSVGITPCTSVSYGKALALAKADGFRSVTLPSGEMRYITVEQLASLGNISESKDINQWMANRRKLVSLAESEGMTKYQVGQMYNASGITIAKVGDWAIGTVVAGAVGYGGAKLVSGSDSSNNSSTSSKSKTQSDTMSIKVKGDNNTTIVNYKGNSGQTAGRDNNTASEGGVAGGGTGSNTPSPETHAAEPEVTP